MGRCFMYVKKGCLQGIFSNKKALWEDMLKNKPKAVNLSIKLSPTDVTNLTYAKLCTHLKSRRMLKLYANTELKKCKSNKKLIKCPTIYRIWDVEINKRVKL